MCWPRLNYFFLWWRGETSINISTRWNIWKKVEHKWEIEKWKKKFHDVLTHIVYRPFRYRFEICAFCLYFFACDSFFLYLSPSLSLSYMMADGVKGNVFFATLKMKRRKKKQSHARIDAKALRLSSKCFMIQYNHKVCRQFPILVLGSLNENLYVYVCCWLAFICLFGSIYCFPVHFVVECPIFKLGKPFEFIVYILVYSGKRSAARKSPYNYYQDVINGQKVKWRNEHQQQQQQQQRNTNNIDELYEFYTVQ